jgi:hypothetical protein
VSSACWCLRCDGVAEFLCPVTGLINS